MELGDYTLSGCEGGSNSTYSMETYDGTTYRACQNGKTTFNTTGTSIRFYISVRSGVTVENVTFYPMLVKGTEEKYYEPYGVMPSPEIPSEIQNVEENVNVSVCNRNLFDSKVFTSGSLITVNEDGSLTLANNVNTAGYINAGKKLKELCKGLKAGDLAYLKLVTTASDNIYLQGNSNQYWVSNNSKKITEDMLEDTVIIYGGYQKTDTLKIQITKNTLEDYVPHQEQNVLFPLAQNQKLYLGDYLAEDGIHHVRKKMEFNGSENWIYNNTYNSVYLNISNLGFQIGATANIISNRFSVAEKTEEGINYISSNSIYVKIDGITSLNDYKEKFAEWEEQGNPFMIEGKLLDEEIEPYTEEQQEAYNSLINLKAYEGSTNVYSSNETSPVFKVTYLEETTEKIENEGNIYSRPILRLEKTSYNNVDVEIAGTRFQYNFNDEEYVEIDCEEKAALYEGLNRNRKLEIGYEFPKLSPGENDIKMNERDCIIKAKRKDRWL